VTALSADLALAPLADQEMALAMALVTALVTVWVRVLVMAAAKV
jgi:hypothetical protein